MSLSKLLIGENSSTNNNTKLVLLVGTPILVAAIAGGIFYWKNNRKSQTSSSAEKKKEEPSAPPVSSLNTTPECTKSLKENGNRLFKLGKYDEALLNYTKAIQLINQQPEDNVGGGRGEGEATADGGEQQQKIISNKEQLELLYQNRAAVHEKLGFHNEVIKETTLALELNPRYVKALHRRSKALKLTGFLEEALEDITAVCILEQFSSPNSVQLADDILKEIGAQEGTRLLKGRKQISPSKHSVKSYLRGFCNCPIAKGELKPVGSGGYSSALKLLKAEDFDGIIDLCTEELESANSECKVEASYLRGTFRFLYGSEDTLNDFTYVIENSDKKALIASSLIKRASHYALIDQHELCQKNFDLALEAWPDNVDLWHHRGQVQLTRGDMEGALADMSKAVELQPDYALAVGTKWYVQYRMAVTSGDMGAADVCVRQFQKLVKTFPNSSDVFSLYGQILMENGLYEEAELNFSKVVELDPTNASVVVHKAMSRFQTTGNPQEAIDMLTNALKIDDGNEFIYETLGTLHLQIGELEGASKYIGKALELARSFQELTILSSLKKAAEVQQKVKNKLGLSFPMK